MVAAIIGLSAIAYNQISSILEAKKWPTTMGVVTKSEILEREVWNSDEGRNEMEYTPSVKYIFTVDSTLQSGSRIWYGAEQRSYSQAIKYTERYYLNTSVVVHYNPEKHGQAVLEVNFEFRNLITAIIAFVLLGFLALMFYNDKIKPKREAKR